MEKKKTPYYACMAFPKQSNEFPPHLTNQIVCADSLVILRQLPDNCVDCILTSPPYNFGITYDTTDDKQDQVAYFEMLFQIFDECVRILKYGGRIIINSQPVFSDYTPTHHIISDYFRNHNMIWRNELIWDKQHYNCRAGTLGSIGLPSSPYFKCPFEYIDIYSKGNIKHDGLRENSDISKEEYQAWTNGMWRIAPEHKMKDYGHPAMFPEELVTRLIKLFSFKNDVVLDPFNGAGTTTVVASRLGRRFLGIDISKKYCETAIERLESPEPEMKK